MNFQIRWVLALLSGLMLADPGSARAGPDLDALSALREGRAVLVIRHALAPGTGDPAGYSLGDCSSQRNLSAEGQAQAIRLGQRLREAGIESAQVYSSQWCRCLETGRLLGYGDAEPLTALNSFYEDRSQAEGQTLELIAWLNRLEAGSPVILVTHQVNITELSGQFPASGEGLILALPVASTASGKAAVLAGF